MDAWLYARRALLLPAAAAVLAACGPARADDGTGSDEGEIPARTDLTIEVSVVGADPAAGRLELDPREIRSERHSNLALALGEVPGISGIRRSQNEVEPVIRGLGWERVQTQVDGIPLHGACPARMDPPAASIAGAFVAQAAVTKGLVSVTRGPGGTGGRIEVSTDPDRGDEPGRSLAPFAGLGYDGARDGYAVSAGMEGGTEVLDLRFGGLLREMGDYASAEGTVVPAGAEERGIFASLGARPTASSRLAVAAILRDAGPTDYPALPMNADEIRDTLVSLSFRDRPSSRRIASFEARVGLADVDHLMSNRGKPNRGVVEAETPSEARTLSLGISMKLLAADATVVEVGLDAFDLDRDAVRERRIVATGATFVDHIWPGARQRDVGVFVEASSVLSPFAELRVGARVDRVSSEARGADDPSLGARSIREQWIASYGPGAAKDERTETLLGGNLQLVWRPSPRIELVAGAGLASRAAGVTERFFAFAPAPGGFQVGNPALEHERKRELVLEARGRVGRARLSGAVHFSDFSDYVLTTTIDRRDVNGDGVEDRIRGFVNVPASLYGAEASAVLEPAEGWLVPIGLSWVRGRNDAAGTPLPEIPPLEATLALRREFSAWGGGWIELGARLVRGQDRIDPDFPENVTPGFSLWHLRSRLEVSPGVTIELAVENLLDREYHEHLSREALLAVGDLAAGAEIPQPGRSLTLGVRYAR